MTYRTATLGPLVLQLQTPDSTTDWFHLHLFAYRQVGFSVGICGLGVKVCWQRRLLLTKGAEA